MGRGRGMLDWKDPEQVHAYYEVRKAFRNKTEPSELQQIPNWQIVQDYYEGLDPCRPLDPVPDARMDAENWAALEDYQRMSEPTEKVWRMSQREQQRRINKLLPLLPRPSSYITFVTQNDVLLIIHQIIPPAFWRIHKKSKDQSGWYVSHPTVIRLMHEAGWSLGAGSKTFTTPLRTKRSNSHAVDRKICRIYDYYPLDMAERVRAICEDYESVPAIRRIAGIPDSNPRSRK